MSCNKDSYLDIILQLKSWNNLLVELQLYLLLLDKIVAACNSHALASSFLKNIIMKRPSLL